MSAESNKEIARRFVDAAWNHASFDALDAFLHPGFVAHTSGVRPEDSRAHFRQSLVAARTAFPSLRATTEDVLAEGDRVAVRVTIRGANAGALSGRSPNGQRVAWTRIDIYRIADGKIAEAWTERNPSAMRRQLAAQPADQPVRRRARNPYRVDWGLYRSLSPATRNWWERASLLHFILKRLFDNGDRGEAAIYLDGAKYIVGLGTAEIYALQELIRDRFYDRQADFIAKPGWIVFDVGANVGLPAIMQARRGAHVYAFEPNPACYRRLSRNVVVNGLTGQITALNYAIGSTPGTGIMRVPLGLTTHGSVKPVTATIDGATSTVAITSLDHIVPTLEVQRIDLLKIDVEGAEVEVLRGAAGVLQTVERIIVEYHSPQLFTQVSSLLESNGFADMFRVDVDPGRSTGLVYAKRPQLSASYG